MEIMKFNKDKYVFTSIPSMSLIGDSAENNRSKQLSLFLNELSKYNILLKDLVNFSLKETDRNVALNIAYYISNNEELNESVNSKKDLPITRLSRAVNIKANYLHKWRDYILAYYIILANKEYKSIKGHFKIKLKEDNRVVNLPNKDSDLHRGIVLKSFKKSAYILSSTGEFLRLKATRRTRVGEILEGKEKKGLGNYKIHISIALVMLIFICYATIFEYKKTQSIVVIEASSNIKLELNRFDKVIYAYSPTDKGKLLVANVDVLNKNIDDAMVEVFDYALNNQMIDLSKKTLITVNGKEMKYGEFTKTNKFLTEKNVPILINNGGNQQRLPENIIEEEKAEGK